MPLYLPVDFNAAYSMNKSGQLAEDQIAALLFVLKARSVTGAALFFGYLVMMSMFLAVSFTGDWIVEYALNLMFLIFAAAFFAGVVYGWKMWRSAKNAKKSVPNLVVEKIVGEAVKYNFGMPVKMAGATHSIMLKHGYIKVAGKRYGVLNPQLYGEIVANKKTDFYIAPLSSSGFGKNGVVVNCSN